MSARERRKHRRVSLRLPLLEVEGLARTDSDHALWTSNVSAGGMYFQTATEPFPAEGSQLHFEILVPPGEGYSPAEGTIRGLGRIVRSLPLPQGKVGVAVRFTQPLHLTF